MDRVTPVSHFKSKTKAFDKVPYQRLLKKLNSRGIGGNYLLWIYYKETLILFYTDKQFRSLLIFKTVLFSDCFIQCSKCKSTLIANISHTVNRPLLLCFISHRIPLASLFHISPHSSSLTSSSLTCTSLTPQLFPAIAASVTLSSLQLQPFLSIVLPSTQSLTTPLFHALFHPLHLNRPLYSYRPLRTLADAALICHVA